MTELAYLSTRNVAPFQEQRRNKLQDAVSGIPPANQQQEIAAALELDRERRLELKSKIDECNLLILAVHRFLRIHYGGKINVAYARGHCQK